MTKKNAKIVFEMLSNGSCPYQAVLWFERRACDNYSCRLNVYNGNGHNNGRKGEDNLLPFNCMTQVPSSGMTLDEIGRIFGVSRERIRQIEEKVVRDLRKRMAMAKVREYIEELDNIRSRPGLRDAYASVRSLLNDETPDIDENDHAAGYPPDLKNMKNISSLV